MPESAVRAALSVPNSLLQFVIPRPVQDGQQMTPRLQLLSTIAKPDLAAKSPPSKTHRARGEWAIRVATPMRSGGVRTTERTIDGPAGPLVARLYEPEGLPEKPGLIVLVHGGGWHLLSVDAYNGVAALLADHGRVKVLSVEYRLAPEHPFPAPFEDVLASYRFAVDNAAALGVDPRRIGIGGDSAGGNLSASVAFHLRHDERYRPAFVALLYPAVDWDLDRYPSSRLFTAPLDYDGVARAIDFYRGSKADNDDPRFFVAAATDLSGMPPTYIATAGMDMLRDQGEALGQRLVNAGVDATVRRFDNLPHGFATMLVDADAHAAAVECAHAIREHLSS
ncbi:alpha/beta hydrolase [Antrihabitans sp. YC2-6]|uniref:alpha/beta hydrolase n=1 Tax=Antrihabitans sp. YC2-6 TaxID=2799498 RepID=UPI0027DC6D12|nr:alpha/beta hydrolase [Antrihabitans sp. YC2-6]